MYLLGTLIFLDFCTGVLKATYQKKLNSKIGHMGILKKVGLLFCIVIAHMTDLYLNSGTLLRDITINMFIVMEILSNLENLSSIDRLFPRFLRNVIKEYLETKR
jgi:toxin secretion/phage lysis holin